MQEKSKKIRRLGLNPAIRTAIRLSIIAVFYTAKQKKLRKIRARLRMSKKSCTFAAVFNLRYSARTCIYMDFDPPTLLLSGVGGG